LLLITGIAYANSFPGTFHFDDLPLILENPRVTGPDFDFSAFLDQYGGRPLTFWSFWLTHRIFGNSPSAFHATNLALHAGVVLLLYWLILHWYRDRKLAFTAALLFAVHPVQTQAVNYIWARSLLLMALFTLAAIAVIRKSLPFSLLLFQLAVWSRFEAIAAVLVLVWLAPRRRFWYIGLAALNLGLFLAGVFAYRPAEFAWYHSNPIRYWLNAPAALWRYFTHLAWPFDFSIFRGVFAPGTALILISFLGLGAAAILLWRYRYRAPIPVFAIAWTALFLAPSLAVPNTEIISDSRSYTAFAGFALLGAWIVSSMMGKLESMRWFGFTYGRQILYATSVVLILATTLPTTVHRNRVWQDDVRLWEEAVAVNPGHFHPFYNLGSALAGRGDLASAERAFRKASELNPEDDMSYAGLGYCCEISGDWNSAIRWYRAALSLNPGNRYASQGYIRAVAYLNNEGD